MQSKVAIVYTRDAWNRDFFQVVQYLYFMDALVSGMQTSIASRSGQLAHARPGTDSSKLTKNESGPLEYGNYLRTIAIVAVMCFMNSSFLSYSTSLLYSSLQLQSNPWFSMHVYSVYK